MFKISNFKISRKSKTLIVAEIGQSHLGSIRKTKEIIKKIGNSGAEFIKFQTHISSEESTLDEPFRKQISRYKNRMEYWKDMEFTLDQWGKISSFCKKNNLIFLSSPFSIKAIELLEKVKVPAWKIGSGEFFSKSMIYKILDNNKPIILSTGLSTMKEISKMVKLFKIKKKKFILMQCTSTYPCNIDDVGINILDDFIKKFKCPVGLSDHSGSIYPSLYAMTKGASIIEVHVGDKKDKKNPDNTSSISFEELNELVKARNLIYRMKIRPIKKNKLNKKLKRIKQIFTKSCALKLSKKKGQILKKDDIIFKKPGTGIPESKVNLIIGKKLKSDVSNTRLLKLKNFYL